MKFVLIFMMSVLVVVTHQYFLDQQQMKEMLWLSPYSPYSHRHLDRQLPFLIYRTSKPIHPAIYLSPNEHFNRDSMVSLDGNSQKSVNEDSEFPDTQSRVKGFSLDRPVSPDSNEQANNGRFLFNLFATSGTYTNPFFKTATFTATSSVSLTSIVNCVPSNQMLNGAGAIACARKRRQSVDEDVSILLQDNQFSIAPSETLKLMPTASTYDEDRVHELSSSKSDVITDQDIMSTSPSSSGSRGKRFLFANKNQLVVSTTVTSYRLVNTTVTVTRNLLNPAPRPGVNCNAAAAAAAPAALIPQCVACLPSGYIVCPATG